MRGRGLVAMCALLAACSSSAPRHAAVTSTTSSSTSATTPRDTNEQHKIRPWPTVTAPLPYAGEPLADGSTLVLVHSVDVGRRTLVVDVAQWLTGTAADDEYNAETGVTIGAPDGYTIRNTSPELRTVQAADNVQCTVAWRNGSVGMFAASLDDVARESSAPGGDTFWLTVRDGQVVRIDEQYRP